MCVSVYEREKKRQTETERQREREKLLTAMGIYMDEIHADVFIKFGSCII